MIEFQILLHDNLQASDNLCARWPRLLSDIVKKNFDRIIPLIERLLTNYCLDNLLLNQPIVTVI